MNCVSYTRATSCRPQKAESHLPIMEQNEHIKDYIRSRNWKLVGRYSDRKHKADEDAAFLEMKEDGINRRFDCVITDSIWQCGKDAFQAVMLFRKTFYPAGIHFAVVEDNFCSADHDEKEVEAYLQDIWSHYHGRFTGKRLGIYTVIRHLTMFGYVYDEGNNVLSIEEDSAEIVREIFRRIADGEKPVSIAKDLTARHIETPSEYTVRMSGEPKRVVSSKWTSGMVHSIAKNPKYCGRWERVIDGKNLAEEVGNIVEPEIFDKAQKAFQSRFYGGRSDKNGPNPLAERMWDKESGLPLVKYSNIYRNITDIRFRYPKEKDVRYDRISIDYDEFMQRVQAELIREKQECENVYDRLHSDEGIQFINRISAEAREPIQDIIERMGEVEKRKMYCYSEYVNGVISELTYKKKKGAYLAQLSRLDAELEDVFEKLEYISNSFSDKNPWITLYRYMDDTEELTRKQAMKYIEKILVYRFEKIEMIPYYQEAKSVFPEEWLKGGSYGTDE